MSSKNRLQNQRPGIFRPSVSRAGEGSSESVRYITKAEIEKGISFEEYFPYKQEGSGITNTQQIPIDFSKFENHTFFNSAQTNVNVAFNNIINEYPFDGSRRELEKYLNGLTGFENYVLSKFPTNLGFVVFSGSSSPSTTEGTSIEVKDFSGGEFVDFSSDKSGKSVLALDRKSYTIESHIFLPPIANGNEVIFQKLSGSRNGYTAGVKTDSSTSSAEIFFGVRSGSVSLVTSASIEKDKFNHTAFVYDRTKAEGKLKIYVASQLVASSSKTALFGTIDFNTSPLHIGSGSVHQNILPDNTTFTPNRTLSGALDEIRVFGEARTVNQLKEGAKRNIFASGDMKLYFKFNEPSASFGDNSIVLDSSGKSLHSKITNYSVYNRLTSSYPVALASEQRKFNPILFPAYPEVISLNENLLVTASSYDTQNPNLITRLVPDHYFEEGKNYFAFSSEEGQIVSPYTGSSIPGSGELGSAQILSSFLFVWAKFFDEIKTATDQFSQVLSPSYQDTKGVSANFLSFLMRHYGFDPPSILTKATAEQYFHGENTQGKYVNIEESLQYVRNEILRRLLINVRDIVSSKGTLHSVKSAIRAVGIDPDIVMRIKEYGGPKSFDLSALRAKRALIQPFIDLSGSSNNRNRTTDAQGFSSLSPHIISAYLTGARKEVGFPVAAGAFANVNTAGGGFHGTSTDLSDGLFTSGSWTYEGIYKFPVSGNFSLTQSLARIHVTGTAAPSSTQGVVTNLLAMSGASPSVKLFLRSTTDAYTAAAFAPLEMKLSGVNVMDGNNWNISFGRNRNDDIGTVSSSSFFLRCARQEDGRIFQIETSSSFYKEDPGGNPAKIVFQKSGTMNTSGAFIAIGSQSLHRGTNVFLHSSGIDGQANITDFNGEIAQMRFWSKGLTKTEWKEHVRNPASVGVESPENNFNFNTTISGAFQRLRMDASIDQPVSASDSTGQIILTDFSQNGMHMTGSGFEASTTLFNYEKILYSSISPSFDSLENANKIRPRSFLSSSNISEFGASKAPLYEIEPNDEPQDDPRFSIDFSVTNALNEDIVTMFATLDSIDSAIGKGNIQFSYDYPALQVLRDNYFNKLERKVNFKEFLEFFRWFDQSIGTMIDQVIPKKTDFLGVNFVIEPHSLERSKLQYQYDGQYIGEDFRSDLKGIILLQQFAGKLTKF